MDPNAAVAAWLNSDNRAESRELARAYRDWTRAGGYPARIQVAAHTDTFMQGARYATVRALGDCYATVELERLGLTGITRKLGRAAIAGIVR